MTVKHSFSVLFSAFVFLVCPNQIFSQSSIAAGTPVSIRNANFSDGKAGWSVYEREKGALSVVTENNSASIKYSGSKDWAVSSRTRIPVQSDQLYTFSCSALNKGKDDFSALYVVSISGNTTVSYKAAKTENFSGGSWKTYKTELKIPADVDTLYIRFNGKGSTDIVVKDISINHIPDETTINENKIDESLYQNGKFNGPLSKRPQENFDRGVTVVPTIPSGCFISWRLLPSDSNSISFSVTRIRDDNKILITEEPIKNTTCLTDKKGRIGDKYIVTPIIANNKTTAVSGSAILEPSACTVIPLPNGYGADKVTVADLDGDGNYEYIIKTPKGIVSPTRQIASRRTYSILAYKSNGNMLWKKDLGWNIENGSWYSPLTVADLNGDGKAEVILKTGENTTTGGKDYRSKNGRVISGPEYLSVLDGMTGKEIARTNWPSRKGYMTYSSSCYNQLAIAYLDGKTPCIIAVRGNYDLIRAEAIVYQNNQLHKVWSFSNEFLAPITKGQGGLTTVCADIDNDSRDEVILGSLILDDDGKILSNLKRGCAGGIYYGDLNPSNKGNELAFMIDTKQPAGGIYMIDALTRKQLWFLNEPTDNIYGSGFCADIDETNPGRELYGVEYKRSTNSPDGRRWYLSSSGELIKNSSELNKNNISWEASAITAYWNGSGKKTIIDKSILPTRGSVIMVADLFGDWREEVVIETKTNLSIYSTNIETNSRRNTLMAEPEYRQTVSSSASGILICPDTVKPVLGAKR